MGVISEGEDDDYGIPSVPWLHLLSPEGRRWREHQHLKGRNPDPFLEQQLRDAGQWPPKPKKKGAAK